MRVPMDHPEVWARGKTLEEVVGIGGQLNRAVEQVVTTGRTPVQPNPQNGYQQPPAPTPPPGIADDDYVTGRHFNQEASRFYQQNVQPELRQTWDAVATTNLELIKRDPSFAAVFAKYGPEVHIKLASVDKKYWNVDNLKTIVNLVKADHVEDIANEIASRRLSEMEPTFRSTGAASAPVSSREPELTLKSERLPADYRDRLAKVNMTERDLDDFCRANDMTREEWFNQFEKTAITEGSRRA